MLLLFISLEVGLISTVSAGSLPIIRSDHWYLVHVLESLIVFLLVLLVCLFQVNVCFGVQDRFVYGLVQDQLFLLLGVWGSYKKITSVCKGVIGFFELDFGGVHWEFLWILADTEILLVHLPYVEPCHVWIINFSPFFGCILNLLLPFYITRSYYFNFHLYSKDLPILI